MEVSRSKQLQAWEVLRPLHYAKTSDRAVSGGQLTAAWDEGTRLETGTGDRLRLLSHGWLLMEQRDMRTVANFRITHRTPAEGPTVAALHSASSIKRMKYNEVLDRRHENARFV